MAIRNDLAAIAPASDSQDVAALRLKAKTDPQGAVKETARQFEALLMNVMLKSMRETVSQDGLFDSEQTRTFTAMLDQQLSQSMSRRGMGLAGVLAHQLAPATQAPTDEKPAPHAGVAPVRSQLPEPPAAPEQDSPSAGPSAASDHRLFVQRLASDAMAVSRESGIPARFLIGHAALESGWGRSEIRAEDGTPSHNLFGIKAGRGWKGRSVDVRTTEYEGGVARTKVAAFRVYDSYQESLRDYAKLLATNPRYAAVLQNTDDAHAYAQQLQQAGYATDPHYAAKLYSVIDGKSLRFSQLA